MKKRIPFKKILLLGIGIFLAIWVQGQTITAAQSGNWGDGSTWVGGVKPGSGNDVVINGGFTVTVNTTGEACNSIQLGKKNVSTGTLTFSGTSNLTVTTSITVGATGGSSIKGAGTLTMANGATLTCGSLVSGDYSTYNLDVATSTVVFTGTFTLPSGVTAFNNLTLNSGPLTLGASVTISGILTQSGGNIEVGSYTLTVNGTHTAGTGTISGAGGYTLGSGASFSTAHNDGVSGNIITTTKTFNTNNNFTFNGTSAQVTSTSLPSTINNLTINNTSGVTASSSFTATGTLTITSANPSSTKGALDMGSFILDLGVTTPTSTTGTGDITGTVRRQGTFAKATNYYFNHRYCIFIFPSDVNLSSITSLSLTLTLVSSGTGWMTGTVLRNYQITETGGTGTVYAMFSGHYLDTETELNGNTDTKLSYWYKEDESTKVEIGRAVHNETDNYVTFGKFDIVATTGRYYTLANTAKDRTTWTGGTSTSWTESSNWDFDTPDATTDIVIPNDETTDNNLVLTDGETVNVKSIQIETGGSLTAGNSTINLYAGTSDAFASFDCSGTFTEGTSTVVFNGDGGAFTGTADFYNIEIPTGKSMANRLGSIMNIYGTVYNYGTWNTSLGYNTIDYKGDNQAIIIPNACAVGYLNLILSGTNIILPSSEMVVGGNFTGSGTFSHNDGTVTFGGTDAQIINSGSNTFNNIKVTNIDTTVTASSNISCASFDNGGSSNVASILDMAGYTLTSTTTDNTGATMRFSGASNGLALSTGTVEYTGTTQTVTAGTYSTLNITAAGTKTAEGNITATNLDNGGTGSAASILDMADHTLTVTNTPDNTGATMRFSGASNGLCLSTGTIEYYGTGQTIKTGTYKNLTLSNSSGTNTADGAITSTGTLTTTAGGTLNMGTNALTANNISSNCYIQTQNTSSTPLTAGKSWGGTVEYNGSADQTIAGGDYTTLINSNISGTASIGSNVSATTVTLNPQSELTLASGYLFDATTLNFESSESANQSASFIDMNTAGGFTGTVNAESYMTGGHWHMVTPITYGESISTFIQATGNELPTKGSSYGMTDYSESADAWNSYFETSNVNNLESGKGYLLRRTDDGIVTYSGTLTGGTKTVAISKSGEGWNCIGNPYPSALKMNDAADENYNFLKTNATLLDASYACIYIWDDASTQYKILGNVSFGGRDLGQNFLQAGQGFFIKAKEESDVTFENTMQSHQTTTVLKSSNVSWPGIELSLTEDKTISSAVIAFNEEMNEGLDITYDAGLLRGNTGINIFTRLVEDNGIDFAIQCLPEKFERITIPVGIESPAGKTLQFKIISSNISEKWQLELEDNKDGSTYHITDSLTLPLSTEEEISGAGRFYLRISNPEEIVNGLNCKKTNKNKLRAYFSNGTIFVDSKLDGPAEAYLYDCTGRKTGYFKLLKNTNNSIPASNIKKGIYLLMIMQGQNVYTSKLIFK
jgi:hypothetical protein